MAPMRRIVVRLLLIPALLLLVWSWRDAKLPVTDFSSYWVAGHSLLERHNPYDATEALRMERAAGLTGERPFVMRNPPWTLWLTLPLGVLGHTAALLLWSCGLVVALFVSARAFARGDAGEASGSRDFRRAVLAAFLFAPTLICLSVGQTGPLVLLGLAAFLSFRERNDWWGGAALLLAAVKPHLALLFWVVLLMWIIERRRWRMLAGGTAAGIAAIAVAVAFDPQVFSHYMAMLRTESIERQFIPTLGGWLRSQFGAAWLQIAPACVGVAGAVIYYMRSRREWDWREQMPILLLASIVVAPYGFLFDEVIVLAALLPLAKHARAPVIAAYVVANGAILAAILGGVKVVSPWYIWTPWAWIGLYAWAKAQTRGDAVQVSIPARAE